MLKGTTDLGEIAGNQRKEEKTVGLGTLKKD